jgi:REP element-mobilizing transposase RayT
MPRQPRIASGTGIYHVMLRGINRQDIFEEKEDYVRMLNCLQQMLEQYDDQGNRLPPLCTFYAYCLMSNHVHLLLKVNQEDIGSTIKHLAVTYAIYYNQKYSRSGHVFQDRFKSEPVNDMAYFVTQLRYIHQNPTKAGLVSKVGDYDWSSWKEYTGELPGAACLCATNVTLKRIPLADLRELIEAPLDDDVQCLDLDETVRVTVGDREARLHLREHYGISDFIKVQTLDKEQRNKIIISCLELGTGLRQPTHEVSAEPSSLELCLTRRRKTKG